MSWKKSLTIKALDRMPKTISPREHAVADFLLLGASVAAAAAMYRRSRVAAASALTLAAAEAASMAMTDYPGGIIGMISFPAHGRLGLGLSAMALSMPGLMELKGAPEKQFFYAHAAAATAIIGITDFTGTGRRGQVQREVVHAEA